VQWLRRQVVLPPSVEPSWVHQHYDRPLLDGGMLLATSPGVRAVERIDVATGRRAWIRVLPDVERVLGGGGDAYFVQDGNGITALDAATGKTVWQHAAGELMEAAAGDGNWVVFAERNVAPPRARDHRPELVWLDARSGAEAARIRLDELDAPRGQLGPLVFRDGEILALYGTEDGAPERELLRLVPR
jgi:outer membrane protein assembly factor BamB